MVEMQDRSTTTPVLVTEQIIPALKRREGTYCFARKYTSKGDGVFEPSGFGDLECLSFAEELESKEKKNPWKMAGRMGISQDHYGDFVLQIYEGTSNADFKELFDGKGAHTAYELFVHNEFYKR